MSICELFNREWDLQGKFIRILQCIQKTCELKKKKKTLLVNTFICQISEESEQKITLQIIFCDIFPCDLLD